MMSDEQILHRLGSLIGQSTDLADFSYTAIQEAVKLRSLYSRYKVDLSHGRDVMDLRVDINSEINSLEGTINLYTAFLGMLKRDHQQMHNAD